MKLNFTSFLFSCLLLLLITNSAYGRLRLIAVTNCYSDSINYVPNDSSVFIYSGHRGGGATYGIALGAPYTILLGWMINTNCDTSYVRYYDTTSAIYYMSARVISTYDGHNNMLTQLHQQYDTAYNTWYNDTLYTNAYDAKNNQVSSQIQLWDPSSGSGAWANTTMHRYAYDASNNNVADTSFSWAGSWTDSLLRTYTYDSYNYLVESHLLIWASGKWYEETKHVYALNAGHKPDSVMQYYWDGFVTDWVYSYKSLFTYDAAYNLLSDTNLQFYSAFNMWGDINLHVYTYIGSDVASVEERFYSGGGWNNYSKMNLTYDGAHNLLSSIQQRWYSSYGNYQKEENIYNADNLVTSRTTFTWSATGSWVQNKGYDMQSHFYYEPYVGAGVNNVNMQVSTVQLYPNPAGNYLNITISNTDNRTLTLIIYDMNGRQCRQWQVATGSSYNAIVPTDNLKAGNYIIQINDAKSTTSKQFSVIH